MGRASVRVLLMNDPTAWNCDKPSLARGIEGDGVILALTFFFET